MLGSGVAIALPALAEGLRTSVLLRLLRTANWLWTVVVGLVALRGSALAAVGNCAKAEGSTILRAALRASMTVSTARGNAVAAPAEAAVLAVAVVSPAAAILTATVASLAAATIAVVPTVATLATVAALTAVSVMTPVTTIAGSAAVVAP